MTNHLAHTSNLEAIYQNPADLELGVLTEALPVAVTILAQKTITVGEWCFKFHIIGESHFVRIERRGAIVLQEILACIHLPPTACRHHHRFIDLAAHSYRHEGYFVALNFDSMSGKPRPPQLDPILEFQFPAIYGQIPLTQIHLEMDDERLHWWTTHLYPQPHCLTTVRTYSQFNNRKMT
jgi:hypothetical protein